jgi:quercetin dioxygenase-like cupin family protein
MTPGRPEVGDFDRTEERRPFAAKGYVDILTLGEGTVGRATCEPGWRWSEHVKPIARSESCRMNHIGVILSGRLGWELDDGSLIETSAGEAFSIPPGHDAWVIGDEACVFIDFSGMEGYAC